MKSNPKFDTVSLQIKQPLQSYFSLHRAWYVLFTLVLILGIFFRLAYLDQKVYWVDEVATSVRISGYTEREVIEEVAQQGIIENQQLQKYQQLNSHKSLGDLFHSLAQSPEHAPLYFLFARGWSELFGSSVTAIRSLSVVFSLLGFPCLYWLCQELFPDSQVSGFALMFYSVSPFYVAYAQEARPYSLWTVTILLSSAALLRAIRLKHWPSWYLYGLTLMFSLYTSLFSILVGMSHGIYVVVLETFYHQHSLHRYRIVTLAAITAFIPWIFVIFHHWQALQENTDWMRASMALPMMAAIWIASILLIFGDLPLSNALDPSTIAKALIFCILFLFLFYRIYAWRGKSIFSNKLNYYWLILLSAGIVTFSIQQNFLGLSILLDPLGLVGITSASAIIFLVLLSSFVLFKQAVYQNYLFISILVMTTPSILIVTDLILSDKRSATPRYLIPLQLGILCSVAYLFTIKIINPFTQSKTVLVSQKLWQVVFIILLSFGVFSCSLNLNKSQYYQKNRNIYNEVIAHVVSQSTTPVILVESTNLMDLISLSYSLDKHIKIQLISQTTMINQTVKQFENCFLFNPSNALLKRLRENASIKTEQVFQPILFSPDEIHLALWKLNSL